MNDIRANLRVRHPGYAMDADLHFPAEGISAIFGQSGAGKSTILRCIAGFERGHAHFLSVGENIWENVAGGVFLPPHRRDVGYVFQDVCLFEHLNVRRNIEFGMKRTPTLQRKISLDDVIDLLGIAHLMDRKPGTLSGGERQRVGIARALGTSPRIMLMDEPLAALDMPRKMEVMPYLERLNQELRIPMLYVSHAIDEVARLADHLVLLEAGKVLASGAPSELLTRLDLPLAHGDAAAAVVAGKVVAAESEFDLICVEFNGGNIWLPGLAEKLGRSVRLRIQARDVSLALTRAEDSSILNSLSATVTDLADDAYGQLMVGLDVGGVRLLSRITRKSASVLALETGKSLYAQVKGVAVID